MLYWISGEHVYTVNAVHVNTFCSLWFAQMKHVSAVGAHVVRVLTAFFSFFLQQFGLNALKLLLLCHIKFWSTVRVCVDVWYDIPVRKKRCEWLTCTCPVHLIPTLQSCVHSWHCQPSTGRPVHTPTHIHACRTRALLTASHATKQFPIHGFTNYIRYARCSYTEQNMPFTHRTEHDFHTQNRTRPPHTEQNIPFTHMPSHAFYSQTEKCILFTHRTKHTVHTQNRACYSHAKQNMLFAHRTENVVRTQNSACCTHTTECAVRTQNRANCLHTTGRAVHTQRGALFAHRQSILFTHRTEHIVHIQNRAYCSQKTEHSVHKCATATCPSHTEHSMFIRRAKHVVHTQNRAFCSCTKQSILFTGKIGYSVHTQNRAFCSHAK